MNKLIIRLSEVVAVVCLVAFILFVTADEKVSTADPQQLCDSVMSVADTDELIERDRLYIKKQYSSDASAYEFFSYYSSDSVMDVREILIVKTDKKSAESLIAAIEKARDEKQKLFESYAPEQSGLLKKAALVYEKGFLIYAVGENSDEVLSEFRNNL